LPALASGVTWRALDDEFVVLNPVTDQAHALQGPVALVWRSACDGSWPDLPDEQVNEAVEALVALDLLVPPSGMSRRAMLRGSAIVATTGIISIGLPEVAAFASTGPSGATTGSGLWYLHVPNSSSSQTITYTLVGGGGGAGGPSTPLTAPSVTLGTSNTTSNLSPNQEYYYQVTSVNASGESIGSTVANRTPGTHSGNPRSITLTWAAVPGAVSYNIYRGTTAGSVNELLANQTSVDYTDSSTSFEKTQSPPTSSTATVDSGLPGGDGGSSSGSFVIPASSGALVFTINVGAGGGGGTSSGGGTDGSGWANGGGGGDGSTTNSPGINSGGGGGGGATAIWESAGTAPIVVAGGGGGGGSNGGSADGAAGGAGHGGPGNYTTGAATTTGTDTAATGSGTQSNEDGGGGGGGATDQTAVDTWTNTGGAAGPASDGGYPGDAGTAGTGKAKGGSFGPGTGGGGGDGYNGTSPYAGGGGGGGGGMAGGGGGGGGGASSANVNGGGAGGGGGSGYTAGDGVYTVTPTTVGDAGDGASWGYGGTSGGAGGAGYFSFSGGITGTVLNQTS
jgi:hypothetical protein